ncbi:MAG: SDR family oxidoreductase [Bacteroidales bacterium]|jgi:NAD(P)-dependent dehydrogenase (short-subunit alcohol dehydrogenase family)|nr:SDR family oxidoreductase [Bacteroidales bacterium]
MSYTEEMFALEGKVAVITGGGGVLAAEIGRGMAKAGASIILLDIREENAIATAKEIESHGGSAIGMAANVLDKENLEAVCAIVLKQFGKIDILLNAAGGNQPGATISPEKTVFDLDMGALDKVTSLNFNGTVLPSLVFGKAMADRGEGNIINISSMAAYQAITRVVGYSASKSAVTNFTTWMAMELAMKFKGKIRVNAIAPGFFIGDQNRALLLNEDGSLTSRSEKILNNTPMGRFGEASELIGACLFLASPSASFVTGVVLPVDGGFSIFSGV